MNVTRITDELFTHRIRGHNNSTEMRNLGDEMRLEPEKYMPKVQKIFLSDNFYNDNSLSTMLDKIGATQTIEKMTLEWDLEINHNPLLMVISEIPLPAGTTSVGKGGDEFLLPLNEDRLKPGDIVYPKGDLHVRVQRPYFKQGQSFVYTCVLIDRSKSLPVKYLKVGSEWSAHNAAYEEGSIDSGHVTSSGRASLSNSIGRYRQEDSITGSASKEKLAIGIRDEMGKIHSYYVPYMEEKFWKQWARKTENVLIGARPGEVTGSTGRQVAFARGLDWWTDQYGQTAKTSKLTAGFLNQFLGDLHYGKTAPSSDRGTLWDYTSMQGIEDFNEAMMDYHKQTGAVITANNLTLKQVTGKFHDNSYGVGFQITQYKMVNGLTVNLVYNPYGDDVSLHPNDINPETNRPYASQTHRFFNVKGEGSSANIRTLYKKGEKTFDYIVGIAKPPGSALQATHSGDYYGMTVKDVFGLQVDDPTMLARIDIV